MTSNAGTFRRPSGYDQEEGEADFLTSGNQDPDMMPPRGRAGPAALWEVANGAVDAEMSPEALAAFVDASVRQFSPQERQAFVAQLSETLDLFDGSPSNGNGDSGNAWRGGTPEQQAGAMRRNGNGDRRSAQDKALVQRYRGGFLQRHPYAAGVRVMG